MRFPQTRAAGLAALLAGAGASHFMVPGIYGAMIPKALPGSAHAWALGSGVTELAVAAAIALPATRRYGALAAAALFVGVLPANVKVAIQARKSDSVAYRAGTILRIPLQAPLLAWAWQVRKEA